MKKKNIIIVTISLLVLIASYFGYKGFYLYRYTNGGVFVDEYYNDSIDKLKFEGTEVINRINIFEDEYLSFSNLKIRNEFTELIKLDEGNDKYVRYLLRDEDDNLIASFAMGNEGYTLVDLFGHDEITTYGTDENESFEKIDRNSILKDNNIIDDIDLLQYLAKNKNRKSNIFTSIKEMGEIYANQLFVSIMIPKGNIILLNGDYTGYAYDIVSDKGYIKEYHILYNGESYFFQFVWKDDYFNDEKIKDLLATIVID